MDQLSRTETYKRKRVKSKRKKRHRFITAAIAFVFFALAFVLWLSYQGTVGNRSADPPEPGNGAPHAGQQSPTGSAGTDKPQDQPADGGIRPGTEPGSGPAESSPGSERVSMTFVGDVIFAGNVEMTLKAQGYDYPYREVRSYLQQADFTVANLETPVTEKGGEPEKKQYVYRSSPKALADFKEAGFDLVNLANNHVLDYGQAGLLETFDSLKQAGIPWVGAGRNAAEAFEPVILEKNGVKVAFLGFSWVVPRQEWKAGLERPGVADTYALDGPLKAIRKAKDSADLVVVIVHWGKEREDYPEEEQRRFAREYIDAGADLIIGGHPHVLQGFENYKGKWIAYSLGNFIFTMNENPKTWETVILQASCAKTGDCELKAVPVLTKLANPVPMAQPEAGKLLERLTKISFNAVLAEDGSVKLAENRGNAGLKTNVGE
jgi:poly-gamma-glutamate synthesis protein (capsule biosynthesis protein)